MPSELQSKLFSFWIKPQRLRQVRAAARQDGVSASEFIRRAVEVAIEERTKREVAQLLTSVRKDVRLLVGNSTGQEST